MLLFDVLDFQPKGSLGVTDLCVFTFGRRRWQWEADSILPVLLTKTLSLTDAGIVDTISLAIHQEREK